MKPTPLCLAHRVNSDHIYFFANEHRMRKLSSSDRFPKQEKIQTGQSQQTVLLTSKIRQVKSTGHMET
jgi:hypothetical protein